MSSANIFFERLEEGWGGAASHHPFPAFREDLKYHFHLQHLGCQGGNANWIAIVCAEDKRRANFLL